MRIKDIISKLEELAPSSLQESYDNAGLIVGDPDEEFKGAVVCLDSIEEVIDEAAALGANMVIAHHPIVFSGLKRLNGKNYIERTVIKAIRLGISIYAIHTNLDNVYHGVNGMIASKLGLTKTKILAPKSGLLNKLVTYVPKANIQEVQNAIFEAGAGTIGNYDSCSFQVSGNGTFRAGDNTNPHVGEKGSLHTEEEVRIETIFPSYLKGKIINALLTAHPYEEVAYDVYQLDQKHQQIGSGMIGELKEAMPIQEFLQMVKKEMKADGIRYTNPIKDKVKKIALCGGAGSFLLSSAIGKGADVFITGDFKYHQFFDADNKIVIADIGHYESEQYTIDLLVEYLSEKFPTFAFHFSRINTNPINYL